MITGLHSNNKQFYYINNAVLLKTASYSYHYGIKNEAVKSLNQYHRATYFQAYKFLRIVKNLL